jgi:hypothetical protein
MDTALIFAAVAAAYVALTLPAMVRLLRRLAGRPWQRGVLLSIYLGLATIVVAGALDEVTLVPAVFLCLGAAGLCAIADQVRGQGFVRGTASLIRRTPLAVTIGLLRVGTGLAVMSTAAVTDDGLTALVGFLVLVSAFFWLGWWPRHTRRGQAYVARVQRNQLSASSAAVVELDAPSIESLSE